MKIATYLMTFASALAATAATASPSDAGAISGVCQLSATSGETYTLSFQADPTGGVLHYVVSHYSSVSQEKQTVAEGSNIDLLPVVHKVEVTLSGEPGAKLLTISGIGYSMSRTDRPIDLESITLTLVQSTHPEDGTRAGGAIFYGVEGLSDNTKPDLPGGKARDSNCFHLEGTDAYGF